MKPKWTYPGLALLAFAICLLVTFGLFQPWSRPNAEAAPSRAGALTYYGIEGQTQFAEDTTDDQRARADEALAGATYYGAYAESPSGRSGRWTNANKRQIAKDLALADCGAGCRILAERLPAGLQPGDGDSVITTDLARALGSQWPFGNDFYAVGGISAWGFAATPVRGSPRRMRDRALADCELRRSRETPPPEFETPPCRVFNITQIEDRRPKPKLYPASYTVDLARLVETGFGIVQSEDADWSLFDQKPRHLHGAFSRGPDGARGFGRRAGWPEAGEALAQTWCNADRRPNEGPCHVVLRAVPDIRTGSGDLAVTPELFASFEEWQATEGAGAFAISPFGAWGFSFGYPTDDQDEALQKAADWCWYNARRSWTFRELDKAFLSIDVPCRIVAIRRG